MRLRATVVAVLACLLLAVPGSALAASSPTQDAYSGVAGQQQGGGGEPQATNEEGTEAAQESGAEVEAAGEESSSGTLPFTGFEMALIAIVAVGLLSGGVLLYRRSRHSAQPQG